MKNRINLLGIIAIIAIIGLGFTACNDGSSSTTVTVAVTGVTVAPTTLDLTVGGSTGTLTPTIAPSNATNKAVTWSTSNAAVATINSGIVTAVSAGTATITVTTTDGSKTATCAVTVTVTHSHNWGWTTYTTGSGLRECQTVSCTEKAGIGDTGPGGGKIIYVSTSGFNVAGLGTCYYLESAPTTYAVAMWSWGEVDVTGATGTAIGTGKANTAAIIAAHPNGTVSNNAAKAAVAYTGGGKNDWFLPSKDELNEMYNGRTHLNISLPAWIWSSSQVNSGQAWGQDFDNGDQYYEVKNSQDFVCAVRAF